MKSKSKLRLLCATTLLSSHHAFTTPQPFVSSQQQPSRGIMTTLLAQSSSTQNQKQPRREKKLISLGDLMKDMERNPQKYTAASEAAAKKKKSKRTRSKVDRPKQTYLYASQRKALELLKQKKQTGGGNISSQQKDDTLDTNNRTAQDGDATDEVEPQQAIITREQQLSVLQQEMQQKQMDLARSFGMNNPFSQTADALVGNSLEDMPRIVSVIRLDDNDVDDEEEDASTITSNSFAYILYKPVGWSILGGEKKKNKNKVDTQTTSMTDQDYDPYGPVSSSSSTEEQQQTMANSKKKVKRVKAYDEQTDEFEYVEYNEADILAVLTPKEREELMKEGGLNYLEDDAADLVKGSLIGTEWDDGGYDDDDDSDAPMKKRKKNAAAAAPRMKAVLFDSSSPSLVAWLKDRKAQEGTPIKGGKNWAAIAGAAEIDDSGLVLLTPRDRSNALHVDRCTYYAVLGNGKKMASRSKLLKSIKSGAVVGGEVCDDSTAVIEVVSRLKRGRDQDPVSTIKVSLSDGTSSCSNAVLMCQDRFADGIRGDPLADPLDRRAARRLVHCNSIEVSSLVNIDDEPVIAEAGEVLPDDIAIYANRRDYAAFHKGSYLGRQSGLAQNELTTAYREINGAADGYPGWVIDRYDKWLFVQQEDDPMSVRGPLPSLHDGYTAGVYLLPTQVDRSVMGNEKLKPKLIEGQAAPEYIPVKENGITYLVSLGESFSTGIFLDQRLQRAWLAKHCTKETRVLNCFSHTGAFSIAAATAGASTVSLDLDKKWLDRIRPQMEANGITEWEGKHDCIYGDCFDWLARLAKRNEQFDIVILDPPSTSVNKFGGKGKKRWSVKSDVDELVSLAANLVKSDGLLMTTTNASTLRPEKFAKMCKKGLADAGVHNAKLERVSPMPSDFPSIGCQPVTNMIWRIP